MELEPITDKTNIKGTTAYVKVELLGEKDAEGDIITAKQVTEDGVVLLSNSACADTTVFIPVEDDKPKSKFESTIAQNTKYDINRKFKKGDVVETVDHYRGTHPKRSVVVTDENNGRTSILALCTNSFNTSLQSWNIDSTALNLVQAIEDRGQDDTYSNYIIVQDSETVIVVQRIAQRIAEDRTPHIFSIKEFGEQQAVKLAEQLCNTLNTQHKQ